MDGNDGSYFADAYRYAAAGTPLRMRQAISVSDDDDVDYNRAVTFSIQHRAGRRRQWRRSPNRDVKYLSIDPVTGQLSSGQVLRASPTGIMRITIVAANLFASPPLSSSFDITVYVCDVPGKIRRRICVNRFRNTLCICDGFEGRGCRPSSLYCQMLKCSIARKTCTASKPIQTTSQ